MNCTLHSVKLIPIDTDVTGDGVLKDWIWSPSIWVLHGYTWEDLTERKDLQYPNSRDLWIYPFLMAILQLFLKYCILNFIIFKPLAKFCGVKCKQCNPPPDNKVLEEMFRSYLATPPDSLLIGAARNLGWSVSQVQRWLRQRSAAAKTSKMDKFADCAWQLTYYTSGCTIGIFALYDKPWVYNWEYCWCDFPFQSLPNGVWWYYMVAMGFYWEETLTHFIHPTKKDSNQVLIHHVVTIFLLSFSWICNLTRMGAMIIFMLECNDIPLLLAKLSGYCGNQKMMDRLFVVFVILWVATRLVIYPFGVLKHAMKLTFENIGGYFHMYYIFLALLFVILIMNLIWTYSIVQVILNKFDKGHVSDVRSSDEEEDPQDGIDSSPKSNVQSSLEKQD